MKGYIRVYAGDAHTPQRFWTVGWCTPEELPGCLKGDWIVDDKNLFGPDGTYPREEPKTE